jgi:hypothetical protein
MGDGEFGMRCERLELGGGPKFATLVGQRQRMGGDWEDWARRGKPATLVEQQVFPEVEGSLKKISIRLEEV